MPRMQLLSVCAACGRHVRRAERACPFCAAPRAPDGPDRVFAEPAPRLSRSAMLLAGAAVVAGCQAQRLTPDAAAPPPPDAWMPAPAPAYGIPPPLPLPPDASVSAPDAAVAPDAGLASRTHRRFETRTPRRRTPGPMPVPAYGVSPRDPGPLKR